MLNRFFQLDARGTDVRTEALAGLTTFLTMAYIIFVQPAVLSTDLAGRPTGMDLGAVLVATCVGSALASVLMGLLADYPIALAPGMGENFFFVTVVMALVGMGVPDAWQTALGMVFLSGVAFILLTVFRVREAVIDAISPSMRNGIAVGIGLFIASIGLQHAGLIVGRPGTLVGLSNQLGTSDVAVFGVGLIGAGALLARRVRGALLWGILASAGLALALGKIHYAGLVGLPEIARPRRVQPEHRPGARSRPGAVHHRLPVHGPLRHRRHPGRRCRTGGPDEGEPAAARQPGAARGCDRHHGRRLPRHEHDHLLHRERGGRGGGRPDGPHGRGDRPPVPARRFCLARS